MIEKRKEKTFRASFATSICSSAWWFLWKILVISGRERRTFGTSPLLCLAAGRCNTFAPRHASTLSFFSLSACLLGLLTFFSFA
jgi:hypothetical protein